jgi:CheY-like chemotaxis protein
MAKILLIDDSKALLSHIKRMLVSGGHEVIATSSGSAAVQKLLEVPIDLVLTDLYMPPPDGFEIVRAVRELPRSVPLIVMSSNELAYGVFRDARALGAVAALHKPFTAERLLTTVAQVLEGTSAPLEAAARPSVPGVAQPA